jgi:hypothetical protein
LKTIVFDFETYFDKDYSLSKMTPMEYIMDRRFKAMLIGWKVNNGPVQTKELGVGSDDEVRKIFSGEFRAVCHNAQFDCSILAWRYGIVPTEMFCTMMGARAHITPFSHSMSLDKVSKYIQKELYSKMGGQGAPPPFLTKGNALANMSGRTLFDLSDAELAEYKDYCAMDVELCDMLYKVEREQLLPTDIRMLHLTIRKMVVPQLHVDTQKLEDQALAIRYEKMRLLNRTGMSDRKTLMSNQLFAAALRDLGVEPPMKISPRTGKSTYAFAKTDQVMKDLLEDPPSGAVAALVAARMGHKSTIEETRIQRLLDVSGAFKTPVLPFPLMWFGAHTGRLSGAAKINLQNLQRGSVVREAIVPPPGYKLVVADLSQIEARILASLAGEDRLVSAFANGEDVYSLFASKLYKRTITAEDDPAERFVGKTAILGLGYGCGAEKFREMVCGNLGKGAMTLDEAQVVVSTYRTSYSGIPHLWTKADNAIRFIYGGIERDHGFGKTDGNNTYITVLGGRRIYYPELMRDQTGQWTYTNNNGVKGIKLYGGKMIENAVQAIAQMVIQHAELLIDRAASHLGIYAAGQAHDELIFCVEESRAELMGKLLRKAMTTVPKWYPYALPLECKVYIVDNYRQAK